MTVPSQTPRNLSVAAPGATAFPFEFKIIDASHLLVQVDGNTKTLDVDYTVDGVGNDAGGTVTFVAPLTGGESVLRKRNMPISRSTDFQRLGDFGSATMNNDQDAPVMMIQQLATDVALALRLPDDSAVDTSLPVPVPNYAWRWNESASRVEYFDWTGGWGSPDGASGVGFVQTGLYAALRTVEGKLRDLDVTPQDFGAVGDGVADDTAALFRALDEAKARRGAVFIPPGRPIRVTSGYVQSTAYKDVMIYGAGRTNEYQTAAPFLGSVIILDSVSTGSFFYRQAARHRLQVRDITFRCAQFVQDRSFFEFTYGGAAFAFENVNFESVEKPLVFKEGCYFQNSTLKDVQFRASGTLHSSVDGPGETNRLRGTLLVLDNVNHETSVPANSEKVVCDLRGIRDIQARNFLLEGSSPGSDWTVLRLYNPYDADYIRRPIATFNGFHSEWSGSKPSVCIEQTAGSVIFNNPGAFISIDSKYSLKSQATAAVNGSSFSSVSNPLSDYFVFEDSRCKVSLNDCSTRGLGSLLLPRNITLTNCSSNSSTEALVATPTVSNDMARLVWKFDGGFVQSPATVYQGGGTTSYPSSDATYGRKLVIVPSANNFQYILKLPFTDLVTTEDSISIVLKVKLPTYTGGTVALSLTRDNTAVSSLVSFGSAYSGQIVDIARCVSLADISGSTFGVQLRLTSGAGVVGNAEVICFEIYAGAKIPKVIYPSYPNNVVTYAAAAPTLGSWKQGDIVYNSAPTAGGKVGQVCVSTGSSGTWKPFGAIDA